MPPPVPSVWPDIADHPSARASAPTSPTSSAITMTTLRTHASSDSGPGTAFARQADVGSRGKGVGSTRCNDRRGKFQRKLVACEVRGLYSAAHTSRTPVGSRPDDRLAASRRAGLQSPPHGVRTEGGRSAEGEHDSHDRSVEDASRRGAAGGTPGEGNRPQGLAHHPAELRRGRRGAGAGTGGPGAPG